MGRLSVSRRGINTTSHTALQAALPIRLESLLRPRLSLNTEGEPLIPNGFPVADLGSTAALE